MLKNLELQTHDPQWCLQQFGGVRVPNYRDPTTEEKANVEKLIRGLHAVDEPMVLEAMRSLRMKGFRFKGRSFVLLVPEDKDGPMRTGIFWRVAANVDDFFVQSPHEGHDGVYRSSWHIFEKTRAQALVFNHAHAHSIMKTSPSARSPSDMAHLWESTFMSACVALYNLRPNCATVQVHGMRGGPNFHLLAVNIYNAKFKRNGFAEMFAFGLTKHFSPEDCAALAIASKTLTFPNTFRIQHNAHNTTRQGNVLNKGRDSGRFMHLELDGWFRGASPECVARREKLIAAINDAIRWRKAFLETGISPIPKTSTEPPEPVIPDVRITDDVPPASELPPEPIDSEGDEELSADGDGPPPSVDRTEELTAVVERLTAENAVLTAENVTLRALAEKVDRAVSVLRELAGS